MYDPIGDIHGQADACRAGVELCVSVEALSVKSEHGHTRICDRHSVEQCLTTKAAAGAANAALLERFVGAIAGKAAKWRQAAAEAAAKAAGVTVGGGQRMVDIVRDTWCAVPVIVAAVLLRESFPEPPPSLAVSAGRQRLSRPRWGNQYSERGNQCSVRPRQNDRCGAWPQR